MVARKVITRHWRSMNAPTTAEWLIEQTRIHYLEKLLAQHHNKFSAFVAYWTDSYPLFGKPAGATPQQIICICGLLGCLDSLLKLPSVLKLFSVELRTYCAIVEVSPPPPNTPFSLPVYHSFLSRSFSTSLLYRLHSLVHLASHLSHGSHMITTIPIPLNWNALLDLCFWHSKNH